MAVEEKAPEHLRAKYRIIQTYDSNPLRPLYLLEEYESWFWGRFHYWHHDRWIDVYNSQERAEEVMNYRIKKRQAEERQKAGKGLFVGVIALFTKDGEKISL